MRALPPPRSALVVLVLAALAAGAGVAAPRIPEHPAPALLAAGLHAHAVPTADARHAARATAVNPEFFLDGAFYQPDLAEGFLDPVRRREDLRRLAGAGGRTVFLQYLAHGDHSLLDPFPERADPVRGLLDDAAALGLTVWLGTREDPRLWSEAEVPLTVWKEVGDRALEVVAEAAARYATHPALAGWYWTPEVVWPAEPSSARLRELGRISARHLRRLRSLAPGRPIAVALGPGGTMGHEVPARGWCAWLARTRPDVVVVMDGVGTGHVDVTQLDTLYAAAAGCAERVGAELVADVEVFGPGMPPDPVRLLLQMRAAERRAGTVVAFDLPHHLKLGSVPAGLLAARTADAPTLDTTQIRAPEGAWDGVGLATIDLRLEGSATLHEAVIVTRAPHPEALSLAIQRGEAWEARGAPVAHHGPGRDEVSWRLSLASERASGVRITLRRGSGGLDVVTARLSGVLASSELTEGESARAGAPPEAEVPPPSHERTPASPP